MTATFNYFPFDEGPGSLSLENRWEAMMRYMRTDGVLIGWDQTTLDPSVDDLAVTPGGGLNVQTAVGEAWIQGFMFQQQDDYYLISITPNSSGDPRIDLLCATLNTDDNTIVYSVLEGTPDPSPVPPTPTEMSPVWDLPLAEIYVADGAVTILSGDITDRRVISKQGEGGSSSATLASASGDESLVNSGVGPDLITKSLNAGSNVTLTSDVNAVTISSTNAPSDSPIAYVYKNATTTGLTDGSTTTISFDTAVLNPNSMWDSMTNPERVTIGENGVYYIHIFSGWVGVALANGPIEIKVVLNGTTTIARSRIFIVGTDTLYLNADTLYSLSATDYIRLDVINNSGATLSLSSGANGPSIQALKVRS